MAPKGMKRPAAAEAQAAAKKPARMPTIADKCEVVKATLASAAELVEMDDSVLRLLSSMVTDSLSVEKPSRHEYQEQAVDMLEKAMATIQAALEKQIETLGGELQTCKDGKAAADAEETSAAETFSKLKADLEACLAKAADDAAYQEAVKKSEELEAAKEESNKFLADTEAKLVELKSFEELLQPLIDGTHENMKVAIKTFLKEMPKFGFEKALRDSAPKSLAIPPSSRGTFDGLVVNQLKERTAEVFAEAEKSLAETKVAQEASTAEIAVALQTLTDASTALATDKKAVEEAKKAVKEAKATLKEAKVRGKEAADAVKAADAKKAQAASELQKFLTGPFVYFADLKELAPPPPPALEAPPAAEEAPAAEESAQASVAVDAPMAVEAEVPMADAAEGVAAAAA